MVIRVALSILGLTILLVIGVWDLWREERSRGHGLLNALHLVRLVADQARSDRIVALLDGARASDCDIEHGTVICAKTLLFRLV